MMHTVSSLIAGLILGTGLSIILPEGYFRSTGLNEIELVDTSVEGDPPKYRLGSVNGGGFGAVSFNRVYNDGRHEEAALLYCKQDERYPKHIVVGYCELFLKDAGDGDAAMKRKVSFYIDQIRLWVPITFPNGGSIGGE